MTSGYRLSVGGRKALWAAAYVIASAAIDAALREVATIPDVANWVLYPVLVAGLTLAGNWLRYQRGR